MKYDKKVSNLIASDLIMHDYKNHKPAEPSNIKEMVLASLAFFVTMALLAVFLAVWSVA